MTGLYQDGTSRGLTNSVTYSANNEHVTVSNLAGTRGQVVGQSNGITQVTASYPGSGISVTVPVRVVRFVLSATVPVSSSVKGMVSSREGSNVYLLTGQGLEVFDPVQRTSELKVNGSGTWLDLSPDGNTLLMASSSSSLTAIDTRTWATRPVTAGAATRAVAFLDDHRAFGLTSSSFVSLDMDQGTPVQYHPLFCQ